MRSDETHAVGVGRGELDPRVLDKNRPLSTMVVGPLPSCSKELRGTGGSCFVGLLVELIDAL